MDLKPSRELDRLVAEKIMGLIEIHVSEQTGELLHTDPADPLLAYEIPVPQYSTDIASAWLVVEHIRKNNIRDVLTLASPSDETEYWFATFEKKWHGRASQDLYEWESGESAPHAICLAALKAVGE